MWRRRYLAASGSQTVVERKQLVVDSIRKFCFNIEVEASKLVVVDVTLSSLWVSGDTCYKFIVLHLYMFHSLDVVSDYL
jgi:hypothetical protein